jgi:hypothetical protein
MRNRKRIWEIAGQLEAFARRKGLLDDAFADFAQLAHRNFYPDIESQLNRCLVEQVWFGEMQIGKETTFQTLRHRERNLGS